ncbi:hypothetical protein BA190_08820 [Labrys sp. WJW]|uniref:ABC transporter substrate-binding protein n=1 Tax=Labrys sp. WJW TaxID=1737983 RepID=UPI00082FC332|nr:ABC transporter substrate-binding protein [Labrys sp. WJW]OCC05500.1 hypothetical protein BA190_08820 [Labrys sp. WJW]
MVPRRLAADEKRPGRRLFLAMLGAGLGWSCVPDDTAALPTMSSPRIVVLDWALAATAVSIGANVIGVPAIDYYRRSAVEPALPSGVVDVGLLFTPNFELLDELKPDLIVIPPALQVAGGLLKRTAPVVTISLEHEGRHSIEAAATATRLLASLLRMPQQGEALIEDTRQHLAQAAAEVARWRGRPFFIAMFADGQHLTLFGPKSLFADVLGALALVNAEEKSGFWGGRIVVGLDRLAGVPDAGIILIDAGDGNAMAQASAGGIFWNSLPAVRDGRVFQLPAILENGGLSAADRFARLLVASLKAGVP